MVRTKIESVLRNYLLGKSFQGKVGSRVLQPEVAAELARAGFVTALEDARNELRGAIPVWRSKDTGLVEATNRRRKIDIVVYDRSGDLCAFVEVESDLDDLRREGVCKRNGHYDVWSISHDGSDEFFDSYKSVERMAVAAYCIYMHADMGAYPNAGELEKKLESVSSSRPEVHNPCDIPLFLIAGRTRGHDSDILKPRIDSLGAVLISPQIVS